MRFILSGVGALVSLGLIVTSYGADAEQVVQRPLPAVYAAVETAFQNRAGSVTVDDRGQRKEVAIVVEREPDRKIHYRVDLEGRTVLDMNILFEPADDGVTTAISGEMSLEQDFVRLVSGGNPDKTRYMAGYAVDAGFAEMVAKMADAIEADQPIARDLVYGGLEASIEE